MIQPGLGADLVREVRIADTRFVLDAIGALGSRRQPRRGVTIVDAMDRDRRIDAGVNLDGDQLGSASPEGPVLLLGDQLHRRAGFYNQRSGARLHLVVDGAEHDDLSDITVFKSAFPGHPFFRTGPIEGTRAVAIERAYLTAWLDRVLRGLPNPLLRGETQRYPEVDFQP